MFLPSAHSKRSGVLGYHQSLEEDMPAMACCYSPALLLRLHRPISKRDSHYISQICWASIMYCNAVVQNSVALVAGRTPEQKLSKRYKNRANTESVETKEVKNKTTGESEITTVSTRNTNTCTNCDERDSHIFCTGYHYWFQNQTSILPATK